MASRERMSPVDTAWLRMDRPSNLMMIVGVLAFETRLDRRRVRRIVEERLLPWRRFRQRAVGGAAGYHWEDDTSFDIAHHLQSMPGKLDKTSLTDLVSGLAATPLDMHRPPWQFILVDLADGGTALVSRIHHCIADGIALIGVLLSLTDETPQTPPAAPRRARTSDTRRDHEDPLAGLVEPVSEAISGGIKLGGKLWNVSRRAVGEPSLLGGYARAGVQVAAELGKLLLMPPDSLTRFKGTPGPSKRVAWTDPLPLEEVKVIGKALGCSVNDVLLASVAGALRRYLLECGDDVEDVELRAMVPVNLRSADDNDLGNRFGLVALVLPVGMENPLARLYEVRMRMLELRGSLQAPVTYYLLGASGILPKIVQEQFLDLLASRASAVMTNVPGPQTPRYLAGSRLVQPMFWVPQSGDIGMGVSILSYAGQVQFGLITDAGLVPDPEAAVAHFRSEFEKLVYVVLMEPWDERRHPREVARDLARVLGAEGDEWPDLDALAAGDVEVTGDIEARPAKQAPG